jgi:hypothetical protein
VDHPAVEVLVHHGRRIVLVRSRRADQGTLVGGLADVGAVGGDDELDVGEVLARPAPDLTLPPHVQVRVHVVDQSDTGLQDSDTP